MLRASVGQNGHNGRGDVLYVQLLLSDWLVRSARPALTLDSLCGPKTIAAITQFQEVVTKFVDGRFDVNGPGIKALERKHLEATVSGVLYQRRDVPRVTSRIDSDVMSQLQRSYFATLRRGLE